MVGGQTKLSQHPPALWWGSPPVQKEGNEGRPPKTGGRHAERRAERKAQKKRGWRRLRSNAPTRLPAFRCLCRSRTRPTRQPTNQTNPAPTDPGRPSGRALARNSGDGEKIEPSEAETKEAETTSRRRKRREAMTQGGCRSGYVKMSPEQGKCERRRRDGLPNETEPHTTSEMRRPGPARARKVVGPTGRRLAIRARPSPFNLRAR